MIRPAQLRSLIVVPVLQSMVQTQADQSDMYNIEPAVELVLATGMQETHLGDDIHQLDAGPALGIYQMEPATEKDIWENYLAFRGPLRAAVSRLSISGVDRTGQLAGNLYYATAMCRVRYMRASDPLPAVGDFEAQAAYYLKNYNAGGKATAEEFIDNWHRLQAELAKG